MRSTHPPGKRPHGVSARSSDPRHARAPGDAIRRRAIAVVGWLVLVRAEAAHAATAGVAVELEQQRCVTLEEVRAEVAKRGGRVDAGSTVRLRVRVREAEPPSAVTLDISGEGAHGALSERTIEASSCAEAVSALALVVAMAAEDEEAPVEAPRAEPPHPAPPAKPSQPPAHEVRPTVSVR